MSDAAGQGGRASDDARLPVAVIYHVWPHYRAPVMRAMDASATLAYDFYGSDVSLQGVGTVDRATVSRFVAAPFRRFGSLLWQGEVMRAAKSGSYRAMIFLADPHFLSTWVAAMIARRRGVPVLFWGHGWLRREHELKRRFRLAFHRLADCFLVYSERGQRVGAASGYPAERIRTVYNSLDVDRADALIASGAAEAVQPRSLFADPARPLVICTARLTRRCRFDLLLEAAHRLGEQGRPINVLLVGDGPERAALKRLASERSVAAHFFGACHDEDVVGPLIHQADLTVSPGKIGLTAMHSLMYGTPAITHGDFDTQMPEVEAIEPGRTGAFFRSDDAADLARAIADWLTIAPPREQVRAHARAAIRAKWTPQNQAHIIERAVLELTGDA